MQLPHSRADEIRYDRKVQGGRPRHKQTISKEERQITKHGLQLDNKEKRGSEVIIRALIKREQKQREVECLEVVLRAFREARCPIPVRVSEKVDGGNAAVFIAPISGVKPKPKPRNVSRGGKPKAEEDEDEEQAFWIELPLSGWEESWREWKYTVGDEEIFFDWLMVPVREDRPYLEVYPPEWEWFPPPEMSRRTRIEVARGQIHVSWRKRDLKAYYVEGAKAKETNVVTARREGLLAAKRAARKRVPLAGEGSDSE